MLDLRRDINSLSDFKRNTPKFIQQMKEKGILLLPISDRRLRMVTHLDIDAGMVEYCIQILKEMR